MADTFHVYFWRRDLTTGTVERVAFTEENAPARWTPAAGVPTRAAHHLIDFFNGREGRKVAPRFIYWLQEAL
jgi:hypothetical protein